MCTYFVVERAVYFVVLLKQSEHVGCLELGAERLVLAVEGDAREAVPLLVVDGRRRILGLDAHHARLDLGRRPEVVLADLHQVVDARQQLRVDGQAAVELLARLGRQAERELALEHEYGALEEGPMHEQLEDKGRADLIGHVGHAHVEERQLVLEHVADAYLELALGRRADDALLQLGHEARIDLARDHLLGLLQQLDGHVARARTDLEHHVGRLQRRLLDHARDDERILQNVLAEVLVEANALLHCSTATATATATATTTSSAGCCCTALGGGNLDCGRRRGRWSMRPKLFLCFYFWHLAPLLSTCKRIQIDETNSSNNK